jgi:hypothetical protein
LHQNIEEQLGGQLGAFVPFSSLCSQLHKLRCEVSFR